MLYVATFRHTLDMRRIQEEKIPVADRHRFPACYVGILDTFGTYISTDGEPTAEWLQEEALRRIEEFMQIVPIVPPGYPPTRELTDGDYLLLGPVTRGTYFAPLRWFRSVDHKLIPVDSAIEKIEFHD